MSLTSHLLVTAGSGPAECRIAVRRLVIEIENEARPLDCTIAVTSGPEPDKHGPTSVIVEISGVRAEELATSYEGTVKFTFQSPVRPTHKRKNWFVGVCGIDNPEYEEGDITPPLSDLRFETLRAGGPGGQHQNTTDSAVRAIHIPTGLTAMSRDERSQHRNKATAVKKLGAMLSMLKAEKAAGARKELALLHKRLERGNEVRSF